VIAPAVHPAFIAGRSGFERDRRDDDVPPLRLISVGPLDWTQGYEHAIHAVRLLADRGVDCEYRIAGSGDYDAAVAFARFQLGLEDNVQLLAPLPPGDLREQLAWADAYLCSAVVAGTPAALLEAQAMGLPTVVSDAGRDSAAGDGAALVFRRRDPEALADALARLATDSDLRTRLGLAGRESAAPHDFNQQLRKFEALYRDVLRGAAWLPTDAGGGRRRSRT
jgi:glycosyltransferase involved in cell wall biosynthesis